MGYYDSQDPNNKSTQQGQYSSEPRHTEPQERYRKKKGKGRTALSAFGGAVLGGLIVVMSTPALSNLGWLPYEIDGNTPNEQVNSTQIDNSEPSQAVNLNVSSGITDAVEKVSDAVVGVTNMQSRATSSLNKRPLKERAQVSFIKKKAAKHMWSRITTLLKAQTN